MRAKLAVLAAAVCFGTLGTAQELAGVDASPVSVGLARVLLGGGLLVLGVRWAMSAAGQVRQWQETPLARLQTWVVACTGACGVLAYQPLFFLGTGANGVAVGTVVALGSAPVLTGVVDGLLRRRAPEARWFAATTLCIVGVIMVSGVFGSGVSLGGLGVLWSVAAGGCYAVYALSAKELMERSWSAQRTMGALFGVAAAASVPLLLVVGAEWLLTPRGLALVLWLGVVATALGYLLFGYGLARLPATTVTTLTLAEPLCATLLGIGLLHERLSLVPASGLLVLAAGLAVLTVSRRRADVPAAT